MQLAGAKHVVLHKLWQLVKIAAPVFQRQRDINTKFNFWHPHLINLNPDCRFMQPVRDRQVITKSEMYSVFMCTWCDVFQPALLTYNSLPCSVLMPSTKPCKIIHSFIAQP